MLLPNMYLLRLCLTKCAGGLAEERFPVLQARIKHCSRQARCSVPHKTRQAQGGLDDLIMVSHTVL